jgi:hypothetical protein
MSDLRTRIEYLEKRAAEHELLGALAADPATRDSNRRLSHDLREEAFRLRNELPSSNPTHIALDAARHA